jgi:hypothetical protein
MIEFNTTIGGERVSVALPDASAIPVPAVAAAAVEAKEAYGRLKVAQRQREATAREVAAAKERVSREAAELRIKKKDLPKDIRKSIKAAEEAAADAALAHEAEEAAMRHAYVTLLAEVKANRPALTDAGLEAAEAALQRMAAAREAFASAVTAAHASYGLLGMFTENARTGRSLLKYRDFKGSRRSSLSSVALEAVGQAVGYANLDLQFYKRGGTAPVESDETDDDGEE